RRPSTSSDRLSFANALTRTRRGGVLPAIRLCLRPLRQRTGFPQVGQRDRRGRGRNLDTERVVAERDVRVDLRERQAQVESLGIGAGQVDLAWETVGEVRVLGTPF